MKSDVTSPWCQVDLNADLGEGFAHDSAMLAMRG